MDTLPHYIQKLVLSGVNKDIKVGYFFKKIGCNEDYANYDGDKIYLTYIEMIEAFVKEVVNEAESESIKNELIEKAKKCRDALSVCNEIKKCLMDYEDTCDLEYDFCFTCVYK